VNLRTKDDVNKRLLSKRDRLNSRKELRFTDYWADEQDLGSAWITEVKYWPTEAEPSEFRDPLYASLDD